MGNSRPLTDVNRRCTYLLNIYSLVDAVSEKFCSFLRLLLILDHRFANYTKSKHTQVRENELYLL